MLTNTASEDLYVLQRNEWQLLNIAGTKQFRLLPGQSVIAARYGNISGRDVALKISNVAGMQ